MISEANSERKRSHWTSETFWYLNPILLDLLTESLFLLWDPHSKIMNRIPKMSSQKRYNCDKNIYIYLMVFFVFSHLNLRAFPLGFKLDWDRVKLHDNYVFVNSLNLQRAVNSIPNRVALLCPQNDLVAKEVLELR